jgi:hypothetical protein
LWFGGGNEFNVAHFLFIINVPIMVYYPYPQIPERTSFAEKTET